MHRAHEVNRTGVVAHLLLAGLALVLPARSAEAAPPDANAREREQGAGELAFGFTGGTVSVGAATFHASGVNGAYLRASGADLGSTQPFVLGAAGHGLYFPTRRFVFGLRASGITLDAKDFRHGSGHPGSASAADLFVSPRVTLMHRWGDLSNVGMYLGLDVVKSDVLAPGVVAGLVVAIR